MKLKVVSRQQWGAVAPRGTELLSGPAQTVIIHHTAMPTCCTFSESMQQVKSIQKTHMDSRCFDDIGYNFLVAGDGTVFEGRGWGVVGAHAKGHNHDSVGIAFLGNFNNELPASDAQHSVKQLLQFGVSQGCLHQEFQLCGHRDVGTTECPGEKLYAVLSQLYP